MTNASTGMFGAEAQEVEYRANRARAEQAKLKHAADEHTRLVSIAGKFLSVGLDRLVVSSLADQLAEIEPIGQIGRAFVGWADRNPKDAARRRGDLLETAANNLKSVGAVQFNGLEVSLPSTVIDDAADRLRTELIPIAELRANEKARRDWSK